VSFNSPLRESRDPLKIISIGRFFAPGRGHSKRQLEIVQAFKDLVRIDPDRSWSLVLCGSIPKSEGAYVRQIMKESEGFPIRVIVDAPRETVEQELKSSSFLWHAAGLHEDLQRYPERAEHFGMVIAEAMCCGTIPIVFKGGGPTEIVPSPDYQFTHLGQLPRQTLKLMQNMSDRKTEVRQAAQRFIDPAFEQRCRFQLEKIGILT
jgi:glycosyltransferase involved in cell wall biosynthesis